MAAPKRGKPRASRTSRKRPPSREKARQSAPELDPEPVPAEPADVHALDTRPLIVGIGGSAGSLSPLRELLAALAADSGMAFVVVSHQAPTGHSMLAEILSKCTVMPVREIGDETGVEPNHVYVESRGRNVAIRAAC